LILKNKLQPQYIKAVYNFLSPINNLDNDQRRLMAVVRVRMTGASSIGIGRNEPVAEVMEVAVGEDSAVAIASTENNSSPAPEGCMFQ